MKNVPPDIIFVLRVNLNSPSFNNQQWPTYQKKVTNLNTGLANLKILCFKVPVSLNKTSEPRTHVPLYCFGDCTLFILQDRAKWRLLNFNIHRYLGNSLFILYNFILFKQP